MGYIYKITNICNNKCYIGQTVNTIEQRFKQHIRSSKTNDTALYSAFKKYGIENFSVEQLEECDNNELNNHECYWIEYYDSYNCGYNEILGGDGSTKYNYSEIVQLYLQNYSFAQITQQLGCDDDTITRALQSNKVKLRSSKERTRLRQGVPILLYKNNIFIQEFNSFGAASEYIYCHSKVFVALLKSKLKTYVIN